MPGNWNEWKDPKKQSEEYIKQLEELVKSREEYKARNDANRYLRLGEMELYSRIAPLQQKPVTEKLEELVKEKTQTEVFDSIIRGYLDKPPAKGVRIIKNENGYFLGSNPISYFNREGVRYIKINNNEVVFSQGLEKLLSFQSRGHEDLKNIPEQDLKDYKTFVEYSSSTEYRQAGIYKKVIAILQRAEPIAPLAEAEADEVQHPSEARRPDTVRQSAAGEGLENSSLLNRILILQSAKREGHNNTDKEIKNLLKKWKKSNQV